MNDSIPCRNLNVDDTAMFALYSSHFFVRHTLGSVVDRWRFSSSKRIRSRGLSRTHLSIVASSGSLNSQLLMTLCSISTSSFFSFDVASWAYIRWGDVRLPQTIWCCLVLRIETNKYYTHHEKVLLSLEEILQDTVFEVHMVLIGQIGDCLRITRPSICRGKLNFIFLQIGLEVQDPLIYPFWQFSLNCGWQFTFQDTKLEYILHDTWVCQKIVGNHSPFSDHPEDKRFHLEGATIGKSACYVHQSGELISKHLKEMWISLYAFIQWGCIDQNNIKEEEGMGLLTSWRSRCEREKKKK